MYFCRMKNNALFAVSPIDGRYADKCNSLSNYFSEYALIQYRVRVEIEYLIHLNEFIPEYFNAVFTAEQVLKLRAIYNDFSESDAQKIKQIESVTNHDVKAVEYFIKEKLDILGLSKHKEWVHFGLTSQDINNTSIPLSLKEAWNTVIYPSLDKTIQVLDSLATTWENIPMLAKTHGQPASPTMLGKELNVFVQRVKGQLELCKQIPYSAKFGGATGNLNAHVVSIPEKDWITFANTFVNQTLGLHRTEVTTQIEPYDNLAAFCDTIARINTILIDFSRDVWAYVSMNYFTQKIKEGEIGSSAMPHKVNPIDFENAEGNLGIANAMLQHLASKLPISRLQRDLTDSTVLRNLGVPFAHMLIALQSLQKGMSKLQINTLAIENDLNENWAVVAEALQTILRVHAFPNPYEELKKLTRKNEKITKETISEFIDNLDVSDTIKEQMHQISPFNYTGLSKRS